MAEASETAFAQSSSADRQTKMDEAQGHMSHLNSRLRTAISDVESFLDRMLGSTPSDEAEMDEHAKPAGAMHELINSQGYLRHLIEQLENKISRLSEIA